MKTKPFTRPTIIAAVEFLQTMLSQARFNMQVVRLGLDDEIPMDESKSVAKKAALLASALTRDAARVIDTVDGAMTLGEAAVRSAVAVLVPGYATPEQASFLRGLALDGYVVAWEEKSRPLLRAALPGDIDLPAVDDEVHHLLKQFDFLLPLGHLDQAIDAHTRGDWAAANAQIRTFFEALLASIADRVHPSREGEKRSAENHRTLLAGKGFLSERRNEWAADGKGYINGLFRMLHTEGSHPGLSDEDHSTFRLHMVLVTGRMLLRRYANGG
jgi:hypothetical protein